MTCTNSFPIEGLATLSNNVYVEQLSTSCLSQYAYYIEADKKAIIIDPMRDIEIYLEFLKKRDSKLVYILETHFHADFVSGHVELSEKTGAKIIYGPSAVGEFDFKEAKDRELIELSEKISVRVLHTPGHTLESTCYILTDLEIKKDLAVFTGDTLFLGDVGRPDLACKSNLTSKDLAGLLFESIGKLKELSDDVVVLPGHGAGSACGKNIQPGSASTIEKQKKSNYAFNENLNKEEFIEIVTSNIPSPPQYFFADVLMNKRKIPPIEEIKKQTIRLTQDELAKYISDGGVQVIDSRSHSVIEKTGFIKGSICVSLEMTYAVWSATLLNLDVNTLLVCDEGKEIESITRLTRVGFDKIIGYFIFSDWKQEIEKIRYSDFDENKKVSLSAKEAILDVRNINEFSAPGYIKGANLIPLSTLNSSFENVQKVDSLYILCKGGNRAMVAGSLLKNLGYKGELTVMRGGIDAILVDEEIKKIIVSK